MNARGRGSRSIFTRGVLRSAGVPWRHLLGSGRLILELHASGLSLSRVARGQRRILAQHAIDTELWSRAWDDSLTSLDQPLEKLASTAGVEPCSVQLLYRSPSSIADVLSVPTSGRAAIDAARMAIAEASNTDAGEVTSAASIIGKSSAGGGRMQMLAIADRAEIIDTLLQWVERGGWAIESIIPSHAVGLKLLIDTLDLSQCDAPQLFVLMDDHATYIGAQVEQQLAFTRVIDIGLCTLAVPLESIAAGIAQSSVEESAVADRALELLMRHGIPLPSACIDEDASISGSEYLLAIQPVFQRLIVEIKQSVRFNVRKDQLPNLTLELLGAAAVLPRFDAALSTQLDVSETHTQCDTAKRVSGSTKWPRQLGLDLQTPLRLARRLTQNLRRGLIAGGAIAILALAADAHLQWRQLSHARAELVIATPVLEDAARRSGDQHDLRQRVRDLEHLASEAWSQIGARPLWGHALLEIAGAIPEGVRLTRIEGLRIDDADSEIKITGAVGMGPNNLSSAGIRAFTTTLRDSTLFSRVDLGATQQRTGVDRTILEFKVDVTLVDIPPRWLDEGGSP